MKEKDFHRRLVRRYMENKATDEELEVFFHLLEQGRLDEHINAYMQPGSTIRPAKRRMPRKVWLAAAVMAGVLAAGAIYLLRQDTMRSLAPPVAQQPKARQPDIAPGGDNAVLTLADGSTITLDSTGTGTLSIQGNTTVLKKAGGTLAYQSAGPTTAPQQLQYNTLATPRGGQYQVVLPDGTSVLLNAASTLRFPVAFSGKTREVELSGEAYFEVAKHAARPFRVKLRGQGKEVEVLGTSFNIMAYDDEPLVRTTLVEGKVKVSNQDREVLLLPGQQAVMGNTAGIKVEQAVIAEAVAWKNNEFYFNNTSIYSIMRQVSRWYNVDVSYEDSLQVFLNGNIRKSVPVSQVFRMLELTGEVQFRIRGREVTVSGRH